MLVNTMIKSAREALDKAYAPYSNFRVAACICTEDNQLFTGVNVENAAYSLTLCAESSALCQMVAAGQMNIQSIVIMASSNQLCPPCGACRQRIHEFSNPDTTVYLCDSESVLAEYKISALLPLAFDLEPLNG